MWNLDKYKMNLKVNNRNVFSYNYNVADINHEEKTITPHKWYSVTTSKHINYVAREYGYKVIK